MTNVLLASKENKDYGSTQGPGNMKDLHQPDSDNTQDRKSPGKTKFDDGKYF